jgi:ATP-dependent Clp protease adaptor protein ClpS
VAKVKTRPARKRARKPRLPPFNVVLLDDDDHTYDYVIEGFVRSSIATTEGAATAEEVDSSGF